MPQRGTIEANQPNWMPHTSANALYVGKVIAVNPASHTVDLVLAGGGVVYGAALMETWAGTDYGDLWTPQFLPDPGVPPRGLPAEAWKVNAQRRRDAWAVVAYFDGEMAKPVVLGFFFPEISAMMFDQVQRLTRYVGDSFAAVAKDGSQWLAFDQDGGYVGFHTAAQGRPPDLTGQDYDRMTSTAASVRHFTALVKSGAMFGLDGLSGNATVHGANGADIGAYKNLDLTGFPVVLRGAEDLFLADDKLQGFAGFCRAPASTGDGTLAFNLTFNAAYNRRLAMRERPALMEGGWAGWRRLQDGPAARLELGADGVPRTFWSATGLAQAPITWADAPAVYAPFFLTFRFTGNGSDFRLIPPDRWAVTGMVARNCEAELLVNGQGVAPSATNPVVIHGPADLEVVASAVGANPPGGTVAIWGNHG